MAEILFILVTLYVVYVVQKVNAESKKDEDFKPSSSDGKNAVKDEIRVDATQEKPKTKIKSVKKAKQTELHTKMPAGVIRNPETGEDVKIATSYRMLRRWIKEALVEEKLVDKVYKTSELNDVTQGKINEALVILKTMKKYQ